MGRRDTAYFAGNTSLFITNETRGVPYKWVSLAIAVTYFFFGLRNIFFCGYKLPVGAGEDLVMDIWQDCNEDKVKTIFEGMHGLGEWLVAIIRVSMALTGSTQDMFFTMLLLAVYDTGFLVGCLRVGILDLSYYYLANMFCGFFYETFVCYLAYLAYSKRNKLKPLINDNEDILLKPLFLVQALGWTLYSIKMIVFSEASYILFKTDSQVKFFYSTWHDCTSLPKPHVHDGWVTMAGVHAYMLAGMCVYCYFTPSAKTLINSAGLVTLYYFGTLLLVFRAGVDLVPPTYIAFLLLGFAYNVSVLLQAKRKVDALSKDD